MLTAHNAKRYKGLSPTLHNCREQILHQTQKRKTLETHDTSASTWYMTRCCRVRPTGTGGTGRMELSTILLKYRCKLVWQTWSRRGPVVQQAAAWSLSAFARLCQPCPGDNIQTLQAPERRQYLVALWNTGE